MLPDPLSDRKAARQTLLQQITDALKSDDRFLAAWLTGSLSRHAGDGFSDIDISVVIDPGYFDVLCQRLWIVAGRTADERLKLFQQFGTPAIIHENHNNAPGKGTFTSVTYRENALTVDWTLIDPKNAIRSASHLPLFSKIELPVAKKDTPEAQEKRAEMASEKVAFFWMMTTVAIKYMLRRDIVFFHMLLDGLHRTLIEVSSLVEGRWWTYQSGSQVRLATTQREQRAAIKGIAEQMQGLMPKVVALGGYVPDDSMSVVDYLLGLVPVDAAPIENPIVSIAESDREKVRLFIEALNGYIGKRIGMYIGSEDPKSLQMFLNGFHAAASILGLSRNTDGHLRAYDTVLKERGWGVSSRGPEPEMRDLGMSNDAIIQEMIAIEVETWKRAYNIAE